MQKDRITPEFITTLEPNEIFVFGLILEASTQEAQHEWLVCTLVLKWVRA